jgi:uncharacterized C2H2 Zn-finger protein
MDTERKCFLFELLHSLRFCFENSYSKYMHDKLPRPKRGKRECPECGKVLSGNHMRDLHLKRVHGRTDIEVKTYDRHPCPKCDMVAPTKKRLLIHLVHKHGGEEHVIHRTPNELKKRRTVIIDKGPKS